MAERQPSHYSICDTCGGPGHKAAVCPLKEHYHRQAIRAVLSGTAKPYDVHEALRLKAASRTRSSAI